MMASEVDSVVVSVDGACQLLGGQIICSVGVYWGDRDPRNISSRVSCSTNNQAELIAAYLAIDQAREHGYKHVTIETDSLYVQRIFTQWISKWKQNNWKTYNRKPVKNIQLIRAIDRLSEILVVKFNWVKGHDRANIRNGAAHSLATAAIFRSDADCIEIHDELVIQVE